MNTMSPHDGSADAGVSVELDELLASMETAIDDAQAELSCLSGDVHLVDEHLEDLRAICRRVRQALDAGAE